MQIRKYFSSILSIPLQEINNIIDKKSNRYHKYSVLKKNNVGKRTIYHPSREIKSLQYILVSNIFSKLKTSQYAMAYIKGKKNPLRENAQKHSNFRYNLRIDFENFFASIIFDDLKYYLKKHEEILKDDIEINKKFYKDIEKLCFPKISSNKLPVGAPSSPMISNIVMYELDIKISNLGKKMSNDRRFCYTRYADDIVFSTNQKGLCADFYKKFKILIKDNDTPNLKINESKTRFLSKAGQRYITGVKITPQGNISIGRERKRKIKKMIFKHKKDGLNPKKLKKLRGLLAFLVSVEPDYYDRLVINKGKIVNDILKGKHE